MAESLELRDAAGRLDPVRAISASVSVCSRCHALVADLDAHRVWHVKFAGDMAPTVPPRRSWRKRTGL